MQAKAHAAAGIVALLAVATFWTATVAVETIGTPAQIAAVKTAILWAMAVLIPAMIAAGATGSRLAQSMRSPQVAAKMRRMKVIAANGLAILLPSAVFLALRAQAGQFDTAFYAVQAIELTAGAVNITLLSLNLRAGLALARRRQGLG